MVQVESGLMVPPELMEQFLAVTGQAAPASSTSVPEMFHIDDAAVAEAMSISTLSGTDEQEEL